MAIPSAVLVATKNAKAVEPNLKEKLSIKMHCVDEYFSTQIFDFGHVKAVKVSAASKTVAYCIGLDGLIEYIKEKRSLSIT